MGILVVLWTAKEPVVGWIDNLYGPTAIVHGVAYGILRVLPFDTNRKMFVVPVDNCANVVLSSCWKTAQLAAQRKSQFPPIIYNYVPHQNNGVVLDAFMTVVEKQRDICPLENALWYPFVRVVTNPWLYKLAIFFYHLLPGYILDIILRLKGKKPRLTKLYKKIHMNMDVLSYFMENSFSFNITNSNGLWKSMTKADQKLFPFDMEFFDWEKFFNEGFLGARKYLGKQDPTPESIARGRKSMKR